MIEFCIMHTVMKYKFNGYTINHILIDFIYGFPYRKVCNYFQIAHLFSVIAHLFNQSEARKF